jgi:hypothetical protein
MWYVYNIMAVAVRVITADDSVALGRGVTTMYFKPFDNHLEQGS